MPKLHKDPVFILIKSLSKAEKRQFRLHYTPKKKKTLPLFVQLLNKLDKITQYDENTLLSQSPKLKRQQLSNQKAHLYNHILETLRRLDRKKDIRIHIRQLIDYAQILYNKG